MDWDWEHLAGPFGRTTEGPVWDGRHLYFTHIPQSRIMRFDPKSSACDVAFTDTDRTNGLAMDAQGRLFGCSAGAHAIKRFEADGSNVDLPNLLDGKRINRPNDLAVDSKGRIWFSDPIGRGPAEEIELDHTSVLRLDPTSDRSYSLRRVTYDTLSPNGVLLSPDEQTLYVAHGGYARDVRELRAYDLVGDDDQASGYRVLLSFRKDKLDEQATAEAREQHPDLFERTGPAGLGSHRGVDGMTVDTEGNIIACAGWKKWGPGPMLYVVSPQGRILETHPTPVDIPTNCTFGDDDLGSLYVTTGDGHLFRVRNTGRRGFAQHLQ